MALLDFREIPEANKATGEQDAFELFTRDALECMGFKVLQGPSRGADGGKDLIVEETRAGLVQDTKVKWLVSCKHFASTGESVRPSDEKNVLERVSAASCEGFLGFYSTLPSSGLADLLSNQKIQVKLFDHEEIEHHLLSSPLGRRLIERYFPVSTIKLQPKPAKIFGEAIPVTCDRCGKNLMEPPSGIWVIWKTYSETGEKHSYRYVDFHFACKGNCDRILESKIREKHASDHPLVSGWDDIPDITIPTVFIQKVMAVMNGLIHGDQYEPEVFDKVKTLLLAAFPHVSRHLNDKDQKQIDLLLRIPGWAGGLG